MLSAFAVVGIWVVIWRAAPAETVQGMTGDFGGNVSGLLQILGSYFGSYDFKKQLFIFSTVQRGKSRGDCALSIPTIFCLGRENAKVSHISFSIWELPIWRLLSLVLAINSPTSWQMKLMRTV